MIKTKKAQNNNAKVAEPEKVATLTYNNSN